MAHDKIQVDKLRNFFWNQNCFIFGGDVYKKLRNDFTADLDIACHYYDFSFVVNDLKEQFECQTHTYKNIGDNAIYKGICNKIPVDITVDYRIKPMLATRPKPLKLIKTNAQSYSHIDHRGEIVQNTETDQIINDIKSGRIEHKDFHMLCRDKDKEYFKTWTKYVSRIDILSEIVDEIIRST